MKRLAEIYVYGNFHIASIAAICFYLYNGRLNQAIIIFLASFSYYNLCGIISVKNYSNTLLDKRLFWISKHLTEIIFMMVGSAVLAIFYWMKLYETRQYRIDYIPLIISLVLCILYLFLRHIPILKNLLIGIVWILIMHIWDNWDFSFLDLFLLIYLTCISLWYDQTSSQFKSAFIDILIILPFLIYSIAERCYFLYVDNYKL